VGERCQLAGFVDAGCRARNQSQILENNSC
jgi:hypothetical protein